MNNQMELEMISRRAGRYVNKSESELQQANRSPIYGYENQNIVPLEEAIEKILPFINNNINYVTTAKQKCNRHSNLLTLDESAAIYLYTMPTPLFTTLNTALRAKNRDALKPWFPFLKLFMNGLKKLPSSKILVWRGVSGNIGSFSVKDGVITWWSVNSTTTTAKVAAPYVDAGGTLFAIEAIDGKEISKYSAFPEENEVILLPGTRLRVTSDSFGYDGRLFIVQLAEEITQQNTQRLVHVKAGAKSKMMIHQY
jgi:hypothetical protein